MATIKNGYAVVVHGGVGEPFHYTDGCEAVANAAMQRLQSSKDRLAAAVAAFQPWTQFFARPPRSAAREPAGTPPPYLPAAKVTHDE